MLSETTSPVLPSVVHKLQIMNFLLKHKSAKLSGYVIGTGPEKQVIIYLYRPEKKSRKCILNISPSLQCGSISQYIESYPCAVSWYVLCCQILAGTRLWSRPDTFNLRICNNKNRWRPDSGNLFYRFFFRALSRQTLLLSYLLLCQPCPSVVVSTQVPQMEMNFQLYLVK